MKERPYKRGLTELMVEECPASRPITRPLSRCHTNTCEHKEADKTCQLDKHLVANSFKCQDVSGGVAHKTSQELSHLRQRRVKRYLLESRSVASATRLSYPAASEKNLLPNTYPDSSSSSIQQLHKLRTTNNERRSRRRRGRGGEERTERRSGRSVGQGPGSPRSRSRPRRHDIRPTLT